MKIEKMTKAQIVEKIENIPADMLNSAITAICYSNPLNAISANRVNVYIRCNRVTKVEFQSRATKQNMVAVYTEILDKIAVYYGIEKVHNIEAEYTPAWWEDDTTPAEEQTTETENAPQAAPAAPQVDPITAAMVASIGAPAPAQTVTVTWANGTRATYSANMLDLLKTDPAALDIQDDTTGELVYIKPDTTPTEEAPQAAPATPEQPTTDEQKEEENPMSITPAERIQACNIIIRRGGYRERDLLTRPHEITRGETWNAEHKVVNVTETTPDPDGYRPGCAVDLVTRSIVG